MRPLDRNLRNQLEAAINEAREIAEKAARAALEQLGVHEAAPYDFLDEDARKLRRKLRSHGRRLGDTLLDKRQTLDNLVEDVAYQHWHRMLFAKFLAENDLLMYPDPNDPVAVTLEECEELANDEGASNGWELAARFASQMLPQIFQLDSPIFELSLPPEHQHKLENIVSAIPAETFKASDSLGWVYQFWQSKRKKSVNDAEVKIGAKELPAVTQLFTEPYMVEWLLGTSDLSSLPRLADASHPLSPPPMREGKGGEHGPTPNPSPRWRGLKVLDPCCGSGHFLVAAFLKLVPLRMAQEGLSARDAVDAVLRENIYGLELDFRCVQIAAFALALSAWQYPDAGGYRPLPELNIACSGLAISAQKEEWTSLAKGNRDLEHALGTLWEQFKEAPTLGSLIRPEAGLDQHDLFSLKWCQVRPLLKQALAGESDDDRTEMGVAAQGIVKAAELLTMRYDFIVTNVPYLSRNKQGEVLRAYCEKNYPEGKSDLATVFMERCLDLCVTGGTVCCVLPQNWLFLGAYKAYRKKILENHTFQWIARLGAGAFETISGEIVKAVLCTISRGAAPEDHLIHGVDVSAFRAPHEKAAALQTQPVQTVSQKKQLENPDSIIQFDVLKGAFFNIYGNCLQGTSTGDNEHYLRFYWENNVIDNSRWKFLESVPKCTCFYSGKQQVIAWNEVKFAPTAAIRGEKAFYHYGVCIGQMRELPSNIYMGSIFTNTSPVIIPSNIQFLPAIWSFCSSPSFNEDLRKINQKLSIDNGYIAKICFDLERWQKVAEEKYPHGLPKPYSDDPTQWIFHGHPCKSVVWDDEKKWTALGPLRYDSTVLQVAVARILGYRWPGEGDLEIDLSDETRQILNSLSIFDKFVDDDGIACIPAVRGEAPLADRLLDLLVAAYGEAWSGDTLSILLANAEHAGKSLESWLRDKFFGQHCKLFQNRPFIWQIWDGQRDGFSALVNYHTLTHKKLEVLIYTYLGDWIARQRQDIVDRIDGAQERLDAAESLKKKLELILEGEKPYDIFVRWKPLEKQPIGWEPDLNDGVRLNIRPFMTVPPVKKAGAGVLRDKPNIKWDKDRGKDVETAPWYSVFNGDRINDHHLTLKEKREARGEG